MWQILHRKRDAAAAQAAQATLSAPPNPSQDELLKWVKDSAKEHGFDVVASSLGLKNEYERTSWMRHSVFTQEGRQSHSYEFGKSGIAVIVLLVAFTAILSWVIFI